MRIHARILRCQWPINILADACMCHTAEHNLSRQQTEISRSRMNCHFASTHWITIRLFVMVNKRVIANAVFACRRLVSSRLYEYNICNYFHVSRDAKISWFAAKRCQNGNTMSAWWMMKYITCSYFHSHRFLRLCVLTLPQTTRHPFEENWNWLCNERE